MVYKLNQIIGNISEYLVFNTAKLTSSNGIYKRSRERFSLSVKGHGHKFGQI